ncbi:MAG: hypothetical protein M0036_20760 [Desulfobacteraceae bacterium]|nr:hypothetical protein [Desulfobacteraceae bacterium]
MKNIRKAAFLLICFSMLVSCAMSMQQGQAWLDTKTDPTNLDLSGNWMCPEFSMAQLSQDGRNVTGAFYSGGLIKGVVSGDLLSLLVYDADTVVYIAELQVVDQGTMKGKYVQGSTSFTDSKYWGDLSRPIGMLKMPAHK